MVQSSTTFCFIHTIVTSECCFLSGVGMGRNKTCTHKEGEDGVKSGNEIFELHKHWKRRIVYTGSINHTILYREIPFLPLPLRIFEALNPTWRNRASIILPPSRSGLDWEYKDSSYRRREPRERENMKSILTMAVNRWNKQR